MSLIDMADPQHLAHRQTVANIFRRPMPLEPELYCQRCRDPHQWCNCPRDE